MAVAAAQWRRQCGGGGCVAAAALRWRQRGRSLLGGGSVGKVAAGGIVVFKTGKSKSKVTFVFLAGAKNGRNFGLKTCWAKFQLCFRLVCLAVVSVLSRKGFDYMLVPVLEKSPYRNWVVF